MDVAGFLFNVVKEDIICKKISAARRRWNVRSKVLSDDLEEDEDLHNKLKCDQDTSGEQIAADNVKISTLETIGESASVAQLTADIGMLEKDLFAKSEISEFSNVTAICEKQLAEYREANKTTTEDIESSMLFTIQSVVLIVPRNTRHILRDFSREKCAQPYDEIVVIFRTVPRNQRVFPAVCQSEWWSTGYNETVSCGDEQRYRGHRSDRVGAQEDVWWIG